MSDLSVLTKDQAGLIDLINAEHAAWKQSYEDQVVHAFNCGLALHQLKELVGHGPFMKLRAENFPSISKSAAQRMMSLVDRVQGKLPTVGNLRMLGNGGLTETDKNELLAKVYEMSDGKSITEFYRAMGVIREPKHQEHHSRKPVSPDEQVEAELSAAAKLAQDVIDAVNFLLQAEDTLPKVPRSLRYDVATACVRANKAIRRLGAGKPKKGAG